MKYRNEYMNMTDLGKLFGVSSHQFGKWLKGLGLRDRNGYPTQQARSRQLLSYSYDTWGTCNVLWHVERVVALLGQAGHQLIAEPPSDLVFPPTLIGPFDLHPLKGDRWQITSSDGDAAIVVTGKDNAEAVKRIVNIAHCAGIVSKVLAQTAQAETPTMTGRVSAASSAGST